MVVIIEDEVTIWGQVGTQAESQLRKAVILGQTGVTKSVEGGKSYWNPIESPEKS
jgi:UDP-3-O-[3-hydroxymyristoyl] glucosamine N-acyltransferase